MVDVERWLFYKGTCLVILLAKLHDMYLYKTTTFPHQLSLFKVCLRGGSPTQVSLYHQYTEPTCKMVHYKMTLDI